jgi:hypothetical protein
MKIPFRLLSLAYCIAFTMSANLSFAQIKFGPKVGFNISELQNNTEYIIGKHHISSGYHIGVTSEIRLVKELFLQPGFIIINKGSRYTVGNNTNGNTTGFSYFRFSSLNAEIPLDLMYKFDRHSFKLLLFAGPHFGYGLSGTWEASDGTSSKIHFGNDPVNDLKPFDYGLDFGAGFEFGKIQVSSRYYNGLKVLSTLTPPLKEQKYKVLSISVTYLFGKETRGHKENENGICRTYYDYTGHRKKRQ